MLRKGAAVLMAVILSVCGLVSVASAQLGQQQTTTGADYPMLQGAPQRPGRNADPLNYGSGASILQWYTPSGYEATTTLIVDNTDFANTSVDSPPFFSLGPFDPNPYGCASATPAVGSSPQPWNAPGAIATEATNPFTEPIRVSTTPLDYANRSPDYVYANAVAAIQGGSATSGATATFTWSFLNNPPLNTSATTPTWFASLLPQNYALYVWLPEGPTTSLSNVLYPERYFVYMITYGPKGSQSTFTDVVDTYAAGSGWVRLGNGGLPTNACFYFDGTAPISITLYNTIPYDSNGNLTGSTSQVVYADAAMAVPVSGTYTASPVSAYVRSSTSPYNPVVDATKDQDILNIYGSQPETTTYSSRILVAQNSFTSNATTGLLQGQVRCYQSNPSEWTTPHIPTVLWSYSPVLSSSYSLVDIDADLPGDNNASFSTDTTNTGNYQGTDYLSSPLQIQTDITKAATSATAEVTVAPTTLTNGNYNIYTYIPGNGGGEHYGDKVVYYIYQGNPATTTPVFMGTLNESVAGGWVQLGAGASGDGTTHTGQYSNVSGTAQLTVVFYNVSTDTNDTANLAYENVVEFATAANLAINSTPVVAQCMVNIKQADGTVVPKMTQVALVADETGHIHCLDYLGNGDGTTREYWCYPSVNPNPANTTWQDPNCTAGIDGPTTSNLPTIQTPTQFNLSSAVVAQLSTDQTGYERLFIASSNGRIYCLDMAGRGDYSLSSNAPGSTPRDWSYPNDYPHSPVVNSNLGVFSGSLVFGDTGDGLSGPTIFAAAPQGRLYSLDATGKSSDRTTSVNWTFPSLTSSALPSIVMTPALAFGNLYFGTQMDLNTDGPGTFYAVNASSGAQVWSFNGLTNGAASGSNIAASDGVLGFTCGPATATQAQLNDVPSQFSNNNYAIATQDSVYVLNDNQHLYGFNAETGAFITSADGTRIYDDNELAVSSTANLSFNWISTYDRFYDPSSSTDNGPRLMPMVMIPTNDGHLYGMFANLDDYNLFSTSTYTSLAGWGYSLAGTQPTSLAISNRKMVLNDNAGYMYVWDPDYQNLGLEVYGNAPAQQVYTPNQPGKADAFRYLHIKIVDQATYASLINTNNVTVTGLTLPQSTLTYQAALADAGPYRPSTAVPFAFEWGQSVYIMVYGFNYAYLNTSSTPVAPPTVNIKLSVGGKTVRSISVNSNLFNQSTASPSLYSPTIAQGGWSPWSGLEDGYGVLAFTLQPSGPNALPPGTATITADITTAALSGSAQQEIASDPNPTSPDPASKDGGSVQFNVANPIAIMPTSGTGSSQAYLLGANITNWNSQTNQISTSAPDTYDPSSIVNGSPPSTAYGSTLYQYQQLLQSAGYAVDGQSYNTVVNVYDRSLMALIRPPGKGLDTVRIDRSDLQWQGGATTVYNPLDPNLYPGFEDSPVNSPNNSLDYPNLTRDLLQFVFNPNGSAANPLLNSVSLNPPLGPDGNVLSESNNNVQANYARTLVPSPLQITVNVPKHQPGVNMLNFPSGQTSNPDNLYGGWQPDSNGSIQPQGYYGLVHVYEDSPGSGQFSSQDSYRMFHLTSGVVPSVRLSVDTPTLDFGNLALGTGYSPASPYNQVGATPGPYDPWGGSWNTLYGKFNILSDSNVNSLSLRPAKAQDLNTPGTLVPTRISAGANDPLAWLDATMDTWTNFDKVFAPANPNGNGGNAVMLQKPRVGDLVPHALDVNPHARVNGNTGATGSGPDLIPSYDVYGAASHQPMVGVSLPLGFPSGSYSTTLYVIDDSAKYTSGASLLDIWDPLSVVNNGTTTLSVEPYTDPGVKISWTGREARLTNSSTPHTATMADNLLVSGAQTWNNTTPAAMRDAYGSLLAAWASNRFVTTGSNAYTSPVTTSTTIPAADATRLYLASVSNAAQFNTQSNSGLASTINDPELGASTLSPLRDLGNFQPANGTWFTGQTLNGYPAVGTSIFPTDSYGTPSGSLDRYDLPAFPLSGERDPLWQADGGGWFGSSLMAFVGTSPMSSGTIEHRVFLTQVGTTTGGAVTLSNAVSTSDPLSAARAFNDDPTTTKGKPTVVQTTTGAFVFYPVTAGSQTTVHAVRYTGSGFAPYVSLNFGSGFDVVTDPSATARPYYGFYRGANLQQLIDLTFSGRLRGRPNSEIYLGRLLFNKLADGNYHLTDAAGNDEEQPNAGSPFLFLPQQVNERLLAEGGGLYRARGVEWDRTQQVYLYEFNTNSGSPVNLLSGSPTVDRETGLISYDTTIGGKVYLDPDLGTVRFSSAMPAQNMEIRLTYNPAFLRVTNGTSGAYSGPTGIYDDHYVGYDAAGLNYALWYTANGASATWSSNVQADRTMFFFGKSAGNSLTARPFMTTMRFGIRLPTPIVTLPGGAPVSVAVSGNTGPYQVDPANGRVYFTSADEDRPITITYTGANEADGSQYPGMQVSASVSYVLEHDETPVLIDQAVNEGSLNAFLDPFTYPNTQPVALGYTDSPNARPPLVWMFYTSTRAGGPDVYFQTIAPMLNPVPPSQ
jgi:hypothetical protein